MTTSFIAIRLTHPDNALDPSWDTHYIDKISQVLGEIGTISKSTYGHEISVKTKKHHFHWHVQLERHPDAKQIKGISNYVKRHLKDKHQLELPKGQGYSIQTVQPEGEAIIRWHGYVLKDLETYDDIVMIHQIGFTGQELRDMWSAARRERELSIKTYNKHENKLNNDKQSRKLLWDWLDQQLPHLALPQEYFNPQKDDIFHLVATKIVEYNIQFNDYKIPMDLKRRVISYLASKGMAPGHIAMILMK
jgi:hypothetical protein